MTHLLPIYRPDYGKDERDFIHLEGEFEFPADMHCADLYTILRDRSEMIGGVVSREKIDGDLSVRVYPWNGPGSFRLHFPANDQSVEKIDVLDVNGGVVEEHPIEQMIERGKAAEVGVKILEEHMKPVDIEPNWIDDAPEMRYRIDFASGEMIPIDENGDEIEE